MIRIPVPTNKLGAQSALISALVLIIAELLSGPHLLAQTITYTVVELSAPDADQVPSRLNNLGDLVGRSGDFGAGGRGATIWSRATFKAKHLVLPGADYISASAINDAGQIAGSLNTANSVVPFIWKPKGGLQRITLLRGDNCGQAFDINERGHVAGYSAGSSGARAFLWTRRRGTRNLGSLPGGIYSQARAVNDSDQVAGTSGSPAGDRAVLWTNTGQIRDLGTLPGDTSSEAIAINKAGDVVGYSKGAAGVRAFLWSAATGMHDLGVLPGANASRALDINDLGVVVGSSGTSSSDRAFIWTKEEGLKDLNSAASADLGVAFVVAHAINNLGQILVMGKSPHELNSGGGAALDGNDDCAPAPPSTFLLAPTRSMRSDRFR
jgi:probable HAF family extracellular repeat protein